MADFRFTDRRRLIVGQSVDEAKAVVRADRLPRSGRQYPSVGDTNHFTTQANARQSTDDVIKEMRLNRRASVRKRGIAGTASGMGGGGGVDFATSRPRDPMFYWRQNNLPYDVTKDDELKKIRSFCSILYLTHPVIASCIDIFTKLPLQGMSIRCDKDEQIEDFHGSLFMDDLDYENYLVDISHEKWLVGEAWPLGSFNETLGVWDDDELLSPDDVEVQQSPFLKEPRYQIRLPETLRRVLTERSPRWEYDTLIKNYPELQHYASENALMPVSNMLLKQLRFKSDTFHKRGIPILMRAFRSVVQEEMLNAALDSIADRLYTPLILAKLGASARDLGTDSPWVPTLDDLGDFEESLDAALAGDFRAMVSHFATDIQSVFGRENMPDLSSDFERIEGRIMQTFGISQTMLSGASQGETYAADALHQDILAEMLTAHQKQLQGFFRDRALIVAEAQEHYDFEVRNGKRYVKMEEVLEIDEESGEERIVEQPKLLVPELHFDTLNLSDENTERQFREALVASGVPITMRKRLVGTGIDFEEEVEAKSEEQVILAVQEQETRKETYKSLRDAKLPIPTDLLQDFQAKPSIPNQPAQPGMDAALPTLGAQPQDMPMLAPTMEDQQAADTQNAPAPTNQTSPGGQLILMPQLQDDVPQPGDQRPPESDERRATMPKPAKRQYDTDRLSKDAAQSYEAAVRGKIRTVAAENYVAPDNSVEDTHHDDGTVTKRPENYQPSGRFGAPKHVGARRYVHIPQEFKWDDEAG